MTLLLGNNFTLSVTSHLKSQLPARKLFYFGNDATFPFDSESLLLSLKSNFPLWRPPLLLQKHYACFSKQSSTVTVTSYFIGGNYSILTVTSHFSLGKCSTLKVPPHFPLGKSSLMLYTTVSTWKLFHLDKDITISFHSTVQLLLYTLKAYFCTQWEPTSAHIKSLLLHTLRAYFCTH